MFRGAESEQEISVSDSDAEAAAAAASSDSPARSGGILGPVRHSDAPGPAQRPPADCSATLVASNRLELRGGGRSTTSLSRRAAPSGSWTPAHSQSRFAPPPRRQQPGRQPESRIEPSDLIQPAPPGRSRGELREAPGPGTAVSASEIPPPPPPPQRDSSGAPAGLRRCLSGARSSGTGRCGGKRRPADGPTAAPLAGPR